MGWWIFDMNAVGHWVYESLWTLLQTFVCWLYVYRFWIYDLTIAMRCFDHVLEFCAQICWRNGVNRNATQPLSIYFTECRLEIWFNYTHGVSAGHLVLNFNFYKMLGRTWTAIFVDFKISEPRFENRGVVISDVSILVKNYTTSSMKIALNWLIRQASKNVWCNFLIELD